MGRTRRSGSTAGEALPLQLHIAGPQKGVGSVSLSWPASRQTLAQAGGRGPHFTDTGVVRCEERRA